MFSVSVREVEDEVRHDEDAPKAPAHVRHVRSSADVAIRRARVVEKSLSAFLVARQTPFQQHARVVSLLGTREPGSGAHARVQLRCVLEVRFGVLGSNPRREDTEIAGHRASHPLRYIDDA